jgi:hypothetical protein
MARAELTKQEFREVLIVRKPTGVYLHLTLEEAFALRNALPGLVSSIDGGIHQEFHAIRNALDAVGIHWQDGAIVIGDLFFPSGFGEIVKKGAAEYARKKTT